MRTGDGCGEAADGAVAVVTTAPLVPSTWVSAEVTGAVMLLTVPPSEVTVPPGEGTVPWPVAAS